MHSRIEVIHTHTHTHTKQMISCYSNCSKGHKAHEKKVSNEALEARSQFDARAFPRTAFERRARLRRGAAPLAGEGSDYAYQSHN